MVAVHLRQRYETYVQQFVTNIVDFDELLRANGAIISGSTALHFFLPDTSWHPHHLDIYLPANTFKRFIRTVTSSTTFGWVHAPRRRHALGHGSTRVTVGQLYEDLDDIHSDEERMYEERPPPRMRVPWNGGRTGESDVEVTYSSPHSTDEQKSGPDSGQEDKSDTFIQLEHYSPHRPSVVRGKNFRLLRTLRTPTGRRVNVVRSHANNPISPLRCFWSTLTMNFLTPDGCVCAFPSATLARQGAVKVEPLTLKEEHAQRRYTQRGYTFGDDLLREELDSWDYIFFGEPHLLAVDFRKKFSYTRPYYPVMPTRRGWLSDDRWKVVVPCEFPLDRQDV